MIKKEKELELELEKELELKKEYKKHSNLNKFFKYTIIGFLAVILDYSIMVLFKEVFNMSALYASAIGFMSSFFFNYTLSMMYVFVDFRDGMTKRKAGIIFLITYMMGLGLNQLIMYILIEKIFIHYMIAKIFAIIVVGLWNYFSKKLTIEDSKKS